jgi:hypothetical protein
MPARRFPPPWSIRGHRRGFVVNYVSGQKLDYFYYEEEAGRQSGPPVH